MLFSAIIFLLLSVIVYKEIKRFIVCRKIAHTKGPKMLPLIGNAHQLGKTPAEIFEFMLNLWYKYGNYNLWLGYSLIMAVADVKDVEFILSNNNLIEKSEMYDVMRPWLGDGLLNSTGAKWRKHRKMITPSFHFKILQDFHEIMNKNSAKFIKKLGAFSEDQRIFDFQAEVHHLTLDIICETAMGVATSAMDNPSSNFVSALNYMRNNCCIRMYHPLKSNMAIYKFYPEYKDFKKSLKTIKDFTCGVIEKRMEIRQHELKNADNAVPEDEFSSRRHVAFLDTLLSSTIDGRPLTTQELYEEDSTFMFGGHDTTSSAISFTIFLLSRHLGVQKKVFAEQERIMQGDLKRPATFQEVGEMKYLNMVLKETLRIYPSAPFISRYADKEYNMNGKIIPKDTTVMVLLMALGFNEKTFPDPYRFNPERFDPSNHNETNNPYEYVPFSAGPRNCVGQRFGLLEAKTVVSMIVRNFEILPALDELESKDGYVRTTFGPHPDLKPKYPQYEPVPSTAVTLSSDNGIYIRLKERR